jgi:hypothetical protein
MEEAFDARREGITFVRHLIPPHPRELTPEYNFLHTLSLSHSHSGSSLSSCHLLFRKSEGTVVDFMMQSGCRRISGDDDTLLWPRTVYGGHL